jgi:hypothetical protein
MRRLTFLVLFVCAVTSVTGCCHRRHSCFRDRFRDCVDQDDWDDDDCCDPCGCDPCGSPSTHFGNNGGAWTSDCGCSTPSFDSYSAAPMTYGAPMSGGCNCDSQVMPTYQQPYMQAPTAEPTPTPMTTPETYYSPRPGNGNPPPVPPVSMIPARF